jgi:Protein of unknown function (DUF2892)
MKANVGSIDRTVRIVAGVTLVGLAAAGMIGTWGYIGILPIATGATAWCPAYLPFGFSTCKTKQG